MSFPFRLVSLSTFLFPFFLCAQQPAGTSASRLPSVATEWPGVSYEVVRIERIQDKRLLVILQFVAGKGAPARGAFVGIETPIPPGANPSDVKAGRYDPKPFSVAASEMIDEGSGKKFTALPPVSPPGLVYPYSHVLEWLSPGRKSRLLSVQFPAPSPPAPDELGKEPVQTVTLLLPKAKEPLGKVPLPPSTSSENSPR